LAIDCSIYAEISPSYTSIHPVLKGDNPDASFTTVPYEKGFQFLYYINSTIGDEQFQDFLQYYIYQNFEKSITTVELRRNWETWVQDNYEKEEVNPILANINWSKWMYEGGFSPKPLDFSNDLSNEAKQLALDFIALNGAGAPPNYEDYNTWYANLQVVFQDTLTQNIENLNIAIMTEIDSKYNCTFALNPEIKERWLPNGIMVSYDVVTPEAHDFVSSVGRSKYVKPIY